MAVSTRITTTGKSIQVLLDEALSPKAQSRALGAYARQKLRETQELNRKALGHVPDHESFVDGRPSDDFDSVKPNGVIAIEFELLSDLFSWIADQLKKHSPERTGAFLRSHRLFADDVEVDPKGEVPPADEYVFISADQPGKARALERGHSRQAPNGVYEVVAVLAQRRFGNQASVHFTYRPLIEGAGRGLIGKARRQAEKDARSPAIVIVPR